MNFFKGILFFAFVALTFSGCHSIHPLSTPQGTIVSEVAPLQKKIGLVLDNEYQTYLSKDRGNPLADPQKYFVGEAIAPLTKHYFEKAALELNTYDSLDAAREDSTSGKYEYVIHPKIKIFDNTIRLTEQRIDIALDADIYDSKLNFLSKVQAQGMAHGDNHPKETVSTAIQLTLSNLIREIKNANL